MMGNALLVTSCQEVSDTHMTDDINLHLGKVVFTKFFHNKFMTFLFPLLIFWKKVTKSSPYSGGVRVKTFLEKSIYPYSLEILVSFSKLVSCST
jgi:hypothetical protein